MCCEGDGQNLQSMSFDLAAQPNDDVGVMFDDSADGHRAASGT